MPTNLTDISGSYNTFHDNTLDIFFSRFLHFTESLDSIFSDRPRRRRWHDLRHTWASWHVQAGTPLHVLQELGGWECVEMVRKYAHLSSEHLVEYVDRLSGLKVVGNESAELATIGLR